MMTVRNLLLTLARAYFALLCCLGGALAQQPNSVAITPVLIDAGVKRGASYTQIYTLSNNTGTRLRFKTSFEDVWYDEKNKRTSGRAGTLPRSASLWVQFSPAEAVVEPRSSVSVKAVITVPETAAGGYYTVPIFAAMPADQLAAGHSQTATATFGLRFRGLMMITTLDASEYNVEIVGGQISPPTAVSELEMQLDLHNRSSTHARVRGAFAILNAAGELAGRGAIEAKRYLPGQRNLLRAGWAGEPPPAGKYTCLITLSYDRVGLEPATLVYEIPFEVK